MTIDAWAAARAGAPLEPFRYEPEPLGEHDCEVAVAHCGICHSDLHLVDDDWGVTRYPLVPGHEIVGTVAAAGASATALVGKRVGIGWQRSACHACDACRSGNENLCPNKTATCVGHHGGFADGIRIDSRFAFEIPEALDAARTAPLLCGGITVYSPLRRFAVGPGSRVAVLGIGGLGHMAVKFASAMGAEVTALSSSPDKAGDARTLGAHAFVATSDAAALKAARNSFDLVLSTVSADLGWPRFVGMLRPHGTLCFVGAVPSPLTLDVDLLLKNERSVTGGAIGSPARIREMLAFAAAHGIGAEIEAMPMASVNEGIERVRANRARYRVVLDA